MMKKISKLQTEFFQMVTRRFLPRAIMGQIASYKPNPRTLAANKNQVFSKEEKMTEISQKPPATIADIIEAGKGTGNGVTFGPQPLVTPATETNLVATPQTLENGETQFSGALVPHPSGQSFNNGPKVLYTKDGVPTYVETTRCMTCDCYFTLTFTDVTRRNRQCAACHFKANGKQGTSMVRGSSSVSTSPTVVVGDTKTQSTETKPAEKKYTSSYSGYSGSSGDYGAWRSSGSYLGSSGYRYRSEVDKFFDSLDKVAEAAGKEIEEISDPDMNNDEHWAKVVASAVKKQKKIETKKSKKSRGKSRTTTALTSRERRALRSTSLSSSSTEKQPEVKKKASSSYSAQRGTGGYHWMD